MGEQIRIFVDGACAPNPGPMGIGIVVEWQGNTAPTIISEFIGEGTNNIAEYTALIEALGFIKVNKIMNAKIHSDSNLIVQQTVGTWKCKDLKLKGLNTKAKMRIDWLRQHNYQIELVYIPRELNLADEPAKLGSKKG